MKNKIFKRFLKNKYTLISIGIFILLIIFGYILFNFLFPNLGSPVYGDRLEGINSVIISEKDFKDISTTLEKNSIVSSANGDLSGKIVNFTIEFKKGTAVEDAKKITTTILENFNNEQVEYFDFQVFFTNENEKEVGYPMIGYKNKTSKIFYYSSAN